MPKSELAKYINDVKKKGHQDHHIRHHLKTHGYPEHLIENAFKELEKKYDFALYIMIFFISVFVIIIAYLGISTILKFTSSQSSVDYCENTSIFIRKYNDQEIICNSFDEKYKIDFLVFNNGTDEINKISFNVIGEKKKFKFVDDTPELFSDTGYVKSYEYDISKGGNIENIQLTPVIKNKRDRYCKNQMIEITDFNSCQS
ncbi:hypothetical protein HOD20_01510 [archaeon]|jgi:hypothetical protein|nr:hypothetical protein [archaeon]MBT4351182.1 hypothetical protein [archaeon]MBT4646800.1 hypothetical protein [archaeon]MBT6821476.1 hypothetical protein [archaeon]MBT7392958.1 hypothetical protein [archaeon]